MGWGGWGAGWGVGGGLGGVWVGGGKKPSWTAASLSRLHIQFGQESIEEIDLKQTAFSLQRVTPVGYQLKAFRASRKARTSRGFGLPIAVCPTSRGKLGA